MLVPLSWLNDYVALPANPAELIERLTLSGLEAIGTRVIGLPPPPGLLSKDSTPVWDRDKIVVAKVLKIDKHPDADKLKLVTCDYGTAEPKVVVTGAPNIAPGQNGMKVILGLRGTTYFLADKEGKKSVATLEPKALRGIMNDAMCMSNYELGIAEDHEGIILLDENDAAPGTPAHDLLGDIVVELDVLPNMARCFGLLGIAREVAALTGAALKTPDLSYPESKERINELCAVAIDDEKLSARYTATIIRNVTVGPAPRFIRSRLLNAGVRSINNVVDITNYVMLECGQPLHAFDYDLLKARAGGKAPAIHVRPAKPGEKLTTLDGVERTLNHDNLIIADSAGPVALAGVMGGRDTEVSDKTKTILLEAAQFDPVSVRKTARQFNLFSEASTRFSRGLHPESAAFGAKRAAQLLQKHAGGEVLAGWVDCFRNPMPPTPIELNRHEIERVLGSSLPDGEIERILLALGCDVEPSLWGWIVTPPANRLDIQIGPADLIEDLARISGYARLPERLLTQEMPPPEANRSLELEDRARDLLVGLGLTECITYSLTSPIPGRAEVKLKNPISPERSVLRTSLVPGLLEVAKRHLETAGTAALFELGPVYLPKDNALPDEPRRLAIVLAGASRELAWDQPAAREFDFYDYKGIVESFLADFLQGPVRFALAEPSEHTHPAKSADVFHGNLLLGSFGELHPKAAAAMGFAGSVYVGGLDFEALLAAVPPRVAFAPFSTFPPAKRDIAVVVPESVSADQVANEVRAAGGDLLADVSLFDVYTGDKIPAGTRSLAYALTYQAPDRTLGDKEIQKAHEKIESRLKHVLKAQIRGKDLP